MKLYPKSLTFSYKEEIEYKKSIENTEKIRHRKIFTIFTILFIIFGFLDRYVSILHYYEFYIIRTMLVMLFITVIISTYTKLYSLCIRGLLSLSFISAGISIVLMMVIEPTNTTYYGGLFLVFFSGYFLLHLDNKWALISGLTILVTYIYSSLYYNGLSVDFISMSFFYAVSNILGMIGNYNFEKFQRFEYKTKNNLIEKIEKQIQEVTESKIATIYALAKLAESRDLETGEHIERVGQYCQIIASAIPLYYYENLDIEKYWFINTIKLASALHDIGKVGIKDSILNKPGPLNQEEYDIMTTHTTIGSSTLMVIQDKYPENSFINIGIEITKSHHERFDGRGYPDGLKGKTIPLSARIMSIADVYDALVSSRPYKQPYSHEKAYEIITKNSGTQFDPFLIKIFIETSEQFKNYNLSHNTKHVEYDDCKRNISLG